MFICPSSWTARNNRRRKKERVKQNKKSDTLGTKKNTQRHVPGPNLTLSRRFSTFRLQRPSYDCSGVLYILTGDSIIIYKLRWRKNSVGPCANLELMVPEHLTDPTRSPRPDSSLQIKKGEKKKKFLAGILRHESSTLALSFTIPCQLSTSKNALNQKRRDDWKEMESVTTWIFRFDAKSTWAYLPPFFCCFLFKRKIRSSLLRLALTLQRHLAQSHPDALHRFASGRTPPTFTQTAAETKSLLLGHFVFYQNSQD